LNTGTGEDEMPFYDWKCGACGGEFEALAPMDEDGRGVRCPHCGHQGAVKQLSAVHLPGKTPTGGRGGCGHDHKKGGG
jgi:putative FmdB family regulatory protein